MSSVSTSLLTEEQTAVLAQLASSRAAVVVAVHEGRLTSAQMSALANERADLATRLYLTPSEPAAHVRAAHRLSRGRLERLPEFDPERLVVADEAHSYTPRKVLRRVLDHALDHLNQMAQWRRWQHGGSAPEPADGWATSAQTFGEDVRPLSSEELASWLWRIDLVVELVAREADTLSPAQLDWTPPDGSWTLRRMLHHLALAEVYYTAWLEAPLPEEPLARYLAASERVCDGLTTLWRATCTDATESLVLITDAGEPTTTDEVARAVLAAERKLIGPAPCPGD